MPDVDTSGNHDPSPTQAELLEIRDRMMRRLEAGEPVRLIRVANLRTTAWRADVRFNRAHPVTFPTSGRSAVFRDRESDRCQQLAETGELWGLERVGLVVEVTEVQP